MVMMLKHSFVTVTICPLRFRHTVIPLAVKILSAFGVDGNPGPLAMIKEGTLKATVFQDGETQVKTAISLIPQILAGETVDDVTVPFILVTSENIDDYLE